MGISHGPPGVATPGAFLFWGSIVNRTVFLVDGFNVFHSARDSERVVGRSLHWLDIAALCSSFLHALPGRSRLAGVFYFSALAHHLEPRRPGLVARQVNYFSALQATGVTVRLGQFKAKDLDCPHCGRRFVRHEEKETDVAIGTKVAELVCRGTCDTLALVSGDSDLVPAIQTARLLDPSKKVAVVFPYRRANAQLKYLADCALTIKAESYARHQLPDVVRAADGQLISRPADKYRR